MSHTRRFSIFDFRFSIGRWGQAKVGLLLVPLFLLTLAACGGQMAEQPRYDPYDESDFFEDGRSSREVVEGAVPRGALQDDTLLYTGSEGGAGTSGGGEGTEGSEGGETTTPADPSGTPVSGEPSATDNQPSIANNQNGGPGGSAAQNGPAAESTVYPFPITMEVLQRGEERYNIYCTPCHGLVGNGDGMAVRRGYPQPPSLHQERLRESPPGHFFNVITNGWGVMPPYAGQIDPEDRWAISAYLQVLQRSQNVPSGELTAEQLEQVNNPPAEGTTSEEGGHE